MEEGEPSKSAQEQSENKSEKDVCFCGVSESNLCIVLLTGRVSDVSVAVQDEHERVESDDDTHLAFVSGIRPIQSAVGCGQSRLVWVSLVHSNLQEKAVRVRCVPH